MSSRNNIVIFLTLRRTFNDACYLISMDAFLIFVFAQIERSLPLLFQRNVQWVATVSISFIGLHANCFPLLSNFRYEWSYFAAHLFLLGSFLKTEKPKKPKKDLIS